jgi:hypothetical protein
VAGLLEPHRTPPFGSKGARGHNARSDAGALVVAARFAHNFHEQVGSDRSPRIESGAVRKTYNGRLFPLVQLHPKFSIRGLPTNRQNGSPPGLHQRGLAKECASLNASK